MIDIDLGRSRRVRVWLEGPPPAQFQPAGTMNRAVRVTSAPALLGERRACLELVVPRGARVEYGLLGASFTPTSDRQDVEIVVNYGEATFGAGPEFDSWLAVAPESPVVGLPKELADPVIIGSAEELEADWRDGPGELRFDVAAHGAYGSSSRLFSLLGRLVVMVLRSPSTEAEDLEGLLAAALSG